jgi:hypothetical protein
MAGSAVISSLATVAMKKLRVLCAIAAPPAEQAESSAFGARTSAKGLLKSEM